MVGRRTLRRALIYPNPNPGALTLTPISPSPNPSPSPNQGADFAFGRSAYERLGYTPPHRWPHGVAADLRTHAAQRAVAAAAAMPQLAPPKGVHAPPKGVHALTKGVHAPSKGVDAPPKGVDALPFFDGATVVLTGGTAGLGVGLLDVLSRHCRRIYLGIPIVSRAIVHSRHAVVTCTCPCTPNYSPHTLTPYSLTTPP